MRTAVCRTWAQHIKDGNLQPFPCKPCQPDCYSHCRTASAAVVWRAPLYHDWRASYLKYLEAPRMKPSLSTAEPHGPHLAGFKPNLSQMSLPFWLCLTADPLPLRRLEARGEFAAEPCHDLLPCDCYSCETGSASAFLTSSKPFYFVCCL